MSAGAEQGRLLPRDRCEIATCHERAVAEVSYDGRRQPDARRLCERHTATAVEEADATEEERL